MLLLIPFVIIVFFLFNRLQTTQAVASNLPSPQPSVQSAVSLTGLKSSDTGVMSAELIDSRLEAIQDLPTVAPIPTATPVLTTSTNTLPGLDEFIHKVADGKAKDVCGLYIPGITALKVVQQPAGNIAYIDLNNNTATQFQSANAFGAVGLLAHNFLAGQNFFHIVLGDDMILVNGDGSTHHYQVSNIADYQRLVPSDLRSNFLEVSSNQLLTADQLFGKFYQKAHHLILQTCINHGGNPDWGVRLIDGNPVQQ